MRLLLKACGLLVDPQQHIEGRFRHLLCQGTCFLGTIKGSGKIYQQTAIDGHSSHVLAKLYLSKLSIKADDATHDRVLPFYEEHNVEIQYLLTHNVREPRARPVGRPFELSLLVLGHSANRAPANQEYSRHTVKQRSRSVAFPQLAHQRYLTQHSLHATRRRSKEDRLNRKWSPGVA
jgi:hypothetical protein